MQPKVHRRQPGGPVDQLDAADERVPQVLALSGRETGRVPGDVGVGGEEEPPGAGGRVDDGVRDGRVDAVDHRVDERPRREVLPGAGLHVLRAARQQLLVGVALDVGAGGRPVLLVDEVDDEPLELRRVLDAVLGLAEDRPEDAALLGQAVEDARVLGLEVVAVGVDEVLPREAGRGGCSPHPSPAVAAPAHAPSLRNSR